MSRTVRVRKITFDDSDVPHDTAIDLVHEALAEVEKRTDWVVDIKELMFTNYYKWPTVRGLYTHNLERIIVVDDSRERMLSTIFHEIAHHVHEREVLGSTGNDKEILDGHWLNEAFKEDEVRYKMLAGAFLRTYAGRDPWEFVAVTIENVFMKGDVNEHVREQYEKLVAPTLPSPRR